MLESYLCHLNINESNNWSCWPLSRPRHTFISQFLLVPLTQGHVNFAKEMTFGPKSTDLHTAPSEEWNNVFIENDWVLLALTVRRVWDDNDSVYGQDTLSWNGDQSKRKTEECIECASNCTEHPSTFKTWHCCHPVTKYCHPYNITSLIQTIMPFINACTELPENRLRLDWNTILGWSDLLFSYSTVSKVHLSPPGGHRKSMKLMCNTFDLHCRKSPLSSNQHHLIMWSFDSFNCHLIIHHGEVLLTSWPWPLTYRFLLHVLPTCQKSGAYVCQIALVSQCLAFDFLPVQKSGVKHLTNR